MCSRESNAVLLEASAIILNPELNWDVGGFVCHSVERERERVGECLYKSGTMCLHFAEGAKRMRSSCASDQPSPPHMAWSCPVRKQVSNGEISPGHYGAGVTTTSSTSFDTTYTDGEGTSNSGSDVTPVATMASTIPFHVLGQADGSSAQQHLWWMRRRSVESCDAGYNSELFKQSTSDEEEMDRGSGDEMKESTSSEERDPKSAGSRGMFMDGSVQSKLSPRGHWRPAEDEELRKLVSQFGPQNWNLIAEKLHGRSGGYNTLAWEELLHSLTGAHFCRHEFWLIVF